MSKKLNHSLAIGLFLIGVLLSSISEGFSQTTNYTWNNTTTNWNTTTAWTPDWIDGGSSASTGNTNVAVFAAGAGNNTVNLASARTVYGLIFTNGANSYNFTTVTSTPRQLDIMNGIGLQNVSGQNQIFNLAVANSAGDGVWSNSVGSTTTFNSGLNLSTSGSSRDLTLAGAGTWNVASAIANGGASTAGKVIVTATGTTTFSGNNTYDGRTTMNAAGGTLTLSGDNSGATGGVTLTAGTLNINNNNALGSGALTLAGAGATINNTSGSAVVNAGNQAWAWSDGLAFGSSTNTAANNLNLGTGVVTASSTRTIALAGTGTKLTIGAVNITSTAASRSITANGVGNTLEMGGLTLSASATPVTVTLAGTANIGVTGAIVNGTTPGNGLTVTATGTTTLSGNNTYTGLTTMNAAGGTLTLSGNNSAASGGVRVTAGTLNVNSGNALGAGMLTLDGASSTINNTSGAAVTNLGNNAVLWDGSSASGFTFGTSVSTSLNNLNLGTGTVTAATSRIMTFAGNGTTLTMGTLDSTTASGSNITFTINGAGNTLVLGGYKIRSLSPSSLDARSDTLTGSANLTINGVIENGNAYSNGLRITGTGVTTFSGNNTYDGRTTMDAAGGTLTLSGDNSGAAGGVTLTAGTLNINNNNALGTGALSLAGTGATINNTSGSAVVNAGGQAWALADGLAFGSATNTAANNLNLGTGVVTATSSRTINLAGNDTKLTIGAVKIENTGSRTITANNTNGTGNTLEMGGLTLSSIATTPVTATLAGTANINVTGAIDSGSIAGNGLTVTATGTTTLSGNNTYTGVTTISAGTTILSGNNSAATGGLVVGGVTGTTDKPVIRLNSVNAISSSSSISGSSASDRIGTLDFAAGTSYTLNNYNGNNMIFTNSYGQASVVTFTNSASILTSSAVSTGARSLLNNSANLKIVFDGNLDIGSSQTDLSNTLGGSGDFVVKGNIFSTTAGSVRGLSKTGTGLVEMRGNNNSYNGDTKIFNGTISVTNGAVLTGTTVRVAPTSGNSGTLLVNGTAGAVVVSARGILAGGGTVGAVTLESGAILNPGNSPGLLTASSATWAAGSTYNWEINNATGAAGTNWDVFSVTGALDMSALSSSSASTKMNLVLNSLSLANFSTSTEYTWVIAKAASLGGISDGVQNLTGLFSINTANFNGGLPANLPNGGFQVVTGTADGLRTLNLMAIPEPSTGSMLGLGLAGLVVTRLLRRKNS